MHTRNYLLITIVLSLIFLSGCGRQSYRKAVEHYVTAVALNDSEFGIDAILELQEAVKLDSTFTQAHSLMGDIYSGQGNYDQAAGAYEKACQLDPWGFNDHFKLGNVYKILKKFAKAVEVLQRAITLKPDHPQANLSLGLCYFELEDYDNARKYCEKAATLDPSNMEIAIALGDIHSKTGNHYESINFYKQALEADPKRADLMIKLGMVYVEQERFEPAELILNKAVDLEPNNPKTHAALGYCFLKNKDPQKALENYQLAYQADKTSTFALNGIGVSYMMLYLRNEKDLSLAEKAIEYWHLSLEVDSSQSNIRSLLEKYLPVVEEKSR